jgi:hypothetical protein
VNAPGRVQRSRTKGWKAPAGAVYVGRGSRWGNPFVVVPGRTPAQAAAEYRAALLEGRLQNSAARVRRELAGRDLMCWCPEGSPCHADVLLDIANPDGAR